MTAVSGRCGPCPGARGRQRGVALVLALWLTTLLALLAGALASESRLATRAAGNVLAAARAELEAEGALLRAIAGLANGGLRAQGRYRMEALDAARAGALAVEIQDVAGLVDLNAAHESLLHGLFRSVLGDSEDAARLAAAVADWRDRDDATRVSGAERAAYERAGRSAGPGNRPFAAVAELRLVLGVDAARYARIRPFVTVHSARPHVDPWSAPEAVLRAVPGVDAKDAAALARHDRRTAPPPALAALLRGRHLRASASRTYVLVATVQGEGAARARLRAVVELPGDPRRPYRILAWERASERSAPADLGDSAWALRRPVRSDGS